MRLLDCRAFQGNQWSRNSYSIAPGYYKPFCTTSRTPVPPKLEQKLVCGWPCTVIFWATAANLIAAVAFICIAIILDRDDVRDELRDVALAVFLGVVSCMMFYWPIVLDDTYLITGNWAVVYILAPLCHGLGSGFM